LNKKNDYSNSNNRGGSSNNSKQRQSDYEGGGEKTRKNYSRKNQDELPLILFDF
jgi:hypothetical protein